MRPPTHGTDYCQPAQFRRHLSERLGFRSRVDHASLLQPVFLAAIPALAKNKLLVLLVRIWAGAQTRVYGITLCAPALFVLLLKVSPQQAAKMMILLSVFGFVGRVSFSLFSEWFGRRNAGGLLGFGAGLLTILAGYNYDVMVMGISLFWLLLAVGFFFADGGFAIVGQNVKFRESIVPRTGDTQFFLYDPDGVGVELNFSKG